MIPNFSTSCYIWGHNWPCVIWTWSHGVKFKIWLTIYLFCPPPWAHMTRFVLASCEVIIHNMCCHGWPLIMFITSVTIFMDIQAQLLLFWYTLLFSNNDTYTTQHPPTQNFERDLFISKDRLVIASSFIYC